MLTFCDDMPGATALVATSNQSAEEMRKANPATARRYTWIELEPPTGDEIFALLRAHWPEVPEAQARHIAVMACGCVGLALQECDAWYAATMPLAACVASARLRDAVWPAPLRSAADLNRGANHETRRTFVDQPDRTAT